MADKYTLSFDCTQEQRDAIIEWQELMGFSSQRQTIEFFLAMGMMGAEMVAGNDTKLDAESFASALYTVVGHFVQSELKLSSTRKVIERFKAWQRIKQEVGSQPIRVLTTPE